MDSRTVARPETWRVYCSRVLEQSNGTCVRAQLAAQYVFVKGKLVCVFSKPKWNSVSFIREICTRNSF
jgi:hypothetical protein